MLLETLQEESPHHPNLDIQTAPAEPRLPRNPSVFLQFCSVPEGNDARGRCTKVLPRTVSGAVAGASTSQAPLSAEHFYDSQTWPLVWALPAFGVICVIWVFCFLVVYSLTPKKARPHPKGSRPFKWAVNALYYAAMFTLAPFIIAVLVSWFLVYALAVSPVRRLRRAVNKTERKPPGPMHPARIINTIIYPSTDTLDVEKSSDTDIESLDRNRSAGIVDGDGDHNGGNERRISPRPQLSPSRSSAIQNEGLGPSSRRASRTTPRQRSASVVTAPLPVAASPSRWDHDDAGRKSVHFLQ